uniref:Large ribosomal subunit protein bL36m n=1 Tax=Amblyomma maculatum TaxID=34609 RepID=G3ML62_AMBMU
MTSLLRSSAVALHLARLQTKPTALARNFSALASTTGHWNNVLRPQFVAEPIMQVAVRTFKDMDVLTKRCKDCYFKKGDDRWYVLCKTHGRHKQRQRLPDERHFWIVTHKTHGPKKRF